MTRCGTRHRQCAASASLTMRTSTRGANSANSPAAPGIGDALSITVVPDCRASRAASSTVGSGISSCMSTTSDSVTIRRAASESSLRCEFASGATTIAFSAAASTITTAVPLGPDTAETASVPTPLARRWASSVTAAASSPTEPTNCTCAPARAAATAWLAPFPPGA